MSSSWLRSSNTTTGKLRIVPQLTDSRSSEQHLCSTLSIHLLCASLYFYSTITEITLTLITHALCAGQHPKHFNRLLHRIVLTACKVGAQRGQEFARVYTAESWVGAETKLQQPKSINMPCEYWTVKCSPFTVSPSVFYKLTWFNSIPLG